MRSVPDHIPQATWKGIDSNRCKALLFAVLRQSVLDMAKPCRYEGLKDLDETAFRKAYNAAREGAYPKFLDHSAVSAWSWFFSESASFATSFIAICKHLGQDPYFARSYKSALSMAHYFIQKDAVKEEEDPCPQTLSQEVSRHLPPLSIPSLST